MARRESERSTAIHAYEKIAGSGIRALNPGGLLLASSCSAHVTADEFFAAIRRAAGGFRAKIYRTANHRPRAPTIRRLLPRAQYLKAVFVKLD